MSSKNYVWSFLFVALGGCVGNDPEPAPEPYALGLVCTDTVCDREARECESRVWDYCGSCVRACSGYCSCTDICDPSTCHLRSCADSECIEWEYEAELGGPDTKVYESCLEYQARAAECGIEPPADCEWSAYTERREARESYSCLARLSCEELEDLDAGVGTSCPQLEPDAAAAARLCSGIAECGAILCEEGTTQEEDLAVLLGRYRADIVQAAMACMDLPCGDRVDCFRAWAEPLRGE